MFLCVNKPLHSPDVSVERHWAPGHQLGRCKLWAPYQGVHVVIVVDVARVPEIDQFENWSHVRQIDHQILRLQGRD